MTHYLYIGNHIKMAIDSARKIFCHSPYVVIADSFVLPRIKKQ